VRVAHSDGRTQAVPVTLRIDTLDEIEYFRNGGILHYVLRGLAKAA
jgi:aconitate hydratase